MNDNQVGLNNDRARYCGLLLLFSCGLVQAQDRVNFNIQVIEGPPCNINNGQAIEVNFGDDLLITRIDGVNYSKTIDYTLDCREAGNNAIRMQIQGLVASFDGNVLATVERPELGVAIKLANAMPMPINGWLNLASSSTKPALTAVPVKAPNSVLQPGRFSAGATMLFEYQ
ncbi:putative minor fimbrial subunit StfE [Serratia quinivorans]|uniref:fimbrial protein n=1 Tax=Serratia quinivorans TaxID=137545 RepID=UPI002177CC75|nr:fimbrial protein [Serratia quinivorans]CAI1123967.1 putative minor fimbrial subunit StfE [Serratia quinivorans]